MAVLLAVALLAGQVFEDGFGNPFEPAPHVEEIAEEPEPEPVHLSPREYLYAHYPSRARRLDCMIRLESTWNPYAQGYRGVYVGLAQFDRSTWMETPQGKAGLSRTDPYASIDAMAWGTVNLGYARWPVTSRRC